MNRKLSDEASSSSQDSNANLNNDINMSKGAIPKTKNFLKNSQNGKKNVKLNNNIENITSPINDPSCSNLCKNRFSKTMENTLVNNSVDMERRLKDFENTEPRVNLLNQENLNNESDSSSSEDNDLSVSDDGCIYTYKADSVPDLPDLFNNLEMPVINNEPNDQRENTSSPEMDFLEMDFEPEPSVDADTEPPFSAQAEQSNEIHTNQNFIIENQEACSSNDLENSFSSKNQESIEKNDEVTPNADKKKKPHLKKIRKDIKMPWSCTPEQRTSASKQLRIIKTDTTSAEEWSANINAPVSKIVVVEGEKIMVWNDDEAYVKQITQIGPLSCSATAILNVLIALRLPVPSLEVICNCEKPDSTSELVKYLSSRSREGSGHREIITGLNKASNGRIYARFFSMYPERFVNLYEWLGFWIKQGAIPIATLNIQKSQPPIPNSWYHQMIYAVDPHNTYLTNPLESVNSSVLWHQLVSESVLLIRREKIIDKFVAGNDLRSLQEFGDPSYDELNVLGQVAKVIREDSRAKRENSHITSHIKIPTVLRSGITLAIDRNSRAYPLLLECPELPLLNLNNCKQ